MTSPEPKPTRNDVLELDNAEQMKALGHPLRLKVLQALGQADGPRTNRELAALLGVDPGHLHFHVRMLQRAGLIELVEGPGREKPYRAVAQHLRVGPELRAAGLASELQGAQLRELQRGFETHAASGEFRSAQVHVRLDTESVRTLIHELVEKLTAAEDDDQPLQTLTIAFHPAIEQAEQDS